MSRACTHEILNYQIENSTKKEFFNNLLNVVQSENKKNKWLACINPHSYVVAKNDENFETALKSADWLIPDGIGIILASRLLGAPLPERITGFDVFENVMCDLNGRGGSVFFLGSTAETLEIIKNNIQLDFPSVNLVGLYSPPFKEKFSERDVNQMVDKINNANADVLWVGMSAPKQEKWIYAVSGRINVNFTGAIGAVFDFYAGKVERSSPFFQKIGLEWLPRLVKEPRRLWKRTLISAPLFSWDVLIAVLFSLIQRKR
ncbi:WecB/TagA/CpsF family glycosyltransferase [Hirschia baltica]|uniref:Glycosyl transferase, WecB/TagA/CpsF family n=1 Tax=Hirschia baltica (strain ATCC 49814 / DSM 5838 / IFAM 1418) TaxID=582402 RepID=C6XK25_HIRBI|nr:WecB/TagA/CpsF family glycosyltransferase [Hirschia baltica]ACT59470.1 glycosyl transferase, WecB/TagA/CpsF family [Hirschia baltica ATCC 49814]